MIRLTTFIASAALASCQPQPDTWRAVIERANGSTYIVEHGASLSDCMALLSRAEYERETVTYCEREQAQ